MHVVHAVLILTLLALIWTSILVDMRGTGEHFPIGLVVLLTITMCVSVIALVAR